MRKAKKFKQHRQEYSVAKLSKHYALAGAANGNSSGPKQSAPAEPKYRLLFGLSKLIVCCVFLLCAETYSGDWDIIAQKRRAAVPQRPGPTRIDYSRFRHSTKQHQEPCNTCHRAPTANWKKVRAFPDVADYPDHDACVRCHRPQFFKGAQPLICSNCHTKVSPRDEVRFAFRNPAQPQQFTVEFPHDKHQDVIAGLRQQRATIGCEQFRRASFVLVYAAEDRVDYNNCTICHTTNQRTPTAPAAGWVDNFVPAADSFKTAPTAHSACFNCHWKNQEPIKDNCVGCHKPAAAHIPVTVPVRKSMKFGHEEKNHIAECTTCHINITKSASLRGLKPDVPITGCTGCHNKSGSREDLNKELVAIDKNKDFVCTYCHTSDVGKRTPPAGHYLVAGLRPRQRKDVK